jgi:hypothetical protein|tara:strand:+ start:921 stop:1622 length:702 start_codon:yes stop_codon:yes gene_type:complete
MNSKGTGLTLALGIVAGFIGYILFQITIGIDTKSDDIATILTNSSNGGTIISIASILIVVGLVVHAAGLWSTKGTASSTSESLGIFCIISAIVIWIANMATGVAMVEMGDKFVAAMAGAGAGDAAAAASAGIIGTAAGFTQAFSVGASTLGGLLAGIGWLFIGIAYRTTDVKGALSFIPLGWLAIIMGLLLIVSNIIITSVVSVEVASQISGISFILIVIWSLSRGIALINEK